MLSLLACMWIPLIQSSSGQGHHRSHRVYAVFTDPTDRVISVSGGVPFGPDLEFAVIGRGSLYKECTGGPCDIFEL